MEVQNETLEEMVPVSPRPFAALQTATAGTLSAALEDEQCIIILTHGSAAQQSSQPLEGRPSNFNSSRQAGAPCTGFQKTKFWQDIQQQQALLLQPRDSTEACDWRAISWLALQLLQRKRAQSHQ